MNTYRICYKMNHVSQLQKWHSTRVDLFPLLNVWFLYLFLACSASYLLLCLVLIIRLIKKKIEQTIAPNRASMNLPNESKLVQSRKRFGSQTECPICMCDIKYEVETICGHMFCCQCWFTYVAHSKFFRKILCPYCRKEVNILFQCFSEAELHHPSSVSESVGNVEKFLQELNSFNLRYSGKRRTFMEYVRYDLPFLFWEVVNKLCFFLAVSLAFSVSFIISFAIVTS